MSKRQTSKQWLSDRSSRDLHDHYHALGVIENRWNIAELQFQRICWFFLGAGPEAGRAATNEMGNVTLSGFLLTLAREVIKEPRAVLFAQDCAKLFNALRDNRNFLTHCRVLVPTNIRGEGMAILQRFQAKGRFNHTMYLMPILVLREIAGEIQAWNEFAERFFEFLAADGSIDRLPSLDRPVQPRNMAQRLQSFQPDSSSQNRPSHRKRE